MPQHKARHLPVQRARKRLLDIAAMIGYSAGRPALKWPRVLP
jgi:hypothetical protein